MKRDKVEENKTEHTRDNDRCSSIDYAAVWSYAVPARRSRLHFKTHSSVRRVLQFKVSGDNICKRTWRTQRDKQRHEFSGNLVAFVVWCCALEVKKYVINVIFKLLLLSWKYTRTMRPPSESRIFPHYQPQNMLQQLQLNQLHAYREASEKERENLIQRLTPPSSDNKQTSVFQALISKESFKLISGTLTGYNSIRPMWLRQEIE